MLVLCFLFKIAAESSFFHRHVRRFLEDYGMPISLVACSALAYWGRFNSSNPSTLPIAKAFEPANGRSWLVPFWHLPGKWVGIAFPFGVALWILFFFDHNVSVSDLYHLNPLIKASPNLFVVINRSRIRIPTTEASRVPLRFFLTWYNHLHCRPARHPCTKRVNPPSSYSHDFPPLNGSCSQG